MNQVILDTDFASDCDDAGAVACLYHYVKQGVANIRMMAINTMDYAAYWGPSALSAVNNYYDHSYVPIGVNKGPYGNASTGGKRFGHPNDSLFTEALATDKRFPSYTPPGTNNVEDAVGLYRRVLATASPKSISIISIGFLSNLANLMHSLSNWQGDGILRTGEVLLHEKVKTIYIMGGDFPVGNEWNFTQDPESASMVATLRQIPKVYIGFKTGKQVRTGGIHLMATPLDNPVREAYKLQGGSEPFERPSWDLVTVIYALEGNTNGFFVESPRGYNDVDPSTGANTWVTDETATDYYIHLRDAKVEGITAYINSMW